MSDNATKVVLALIGLFATGIAAYKEIRLAELSSSKED